MSVGDTGVGMRQQGSGDSHVAFGPVAYGVDGIMAKEMRIDRSAECPLCGFGDNAADTGVGHGSTDAGRPHRLAGILEEGTTCIDQVIDKPAQGRVYRSLVWAN